MRVDPRRKVLSALLSLALPAIYAADVYAAKSVELSKQSVSVLQSFVSPVAKVNSGISYTEMSRSIDARGTLHARIQERYLGYPVWGGDAIVHVPNGSRAPTSIETLLSSMKNDASMDGVLYHDLTMDLVRTPAYVFNKTQSQAALKNAIALFSKQMGANPAIKDQRSELIVYVDQNQKAHWVYKVTFFAEPLREDLSAAKPIYLLDASTFKMYENWDNLQTVGDAVTGGGYGGNVKMGRLQYDGLQGNLASLAITRDAAKGECYLNNDKVTVRSYGNHSIIKFPCEQPDQQHAKLYWDGDRDAVNGGYSPANDALFGGAVIIDLYQQWYGIPVLTKDDKPMMLEMVVHKREDNASWDGRQMTFGDGVKYFFPLTSLGVAAHEISHGFTEQHSDLVYRRQSGAINESFSDMAAQAAEVFAYGKNSWQIGPEIFKEGNRALRYMNYPSRDCRVYGKPGVNCSINHVRQYVEADPAHHKETTNVHHSSGIYNRVFYLIATADGWSVRKAFDVMVAANMHYWTSQITFASGACGVLKATKELGYDKAAVKNAFADVGISTEEC